MKRVLPFVALAVLAGNAAAQRRAVGDRPARFEIMAGANFAKLNGDGGDTDSRTGFVGGVGLVKPLAPGWAFEPEITFSTKGGKGSNGPVESTVKLNYIEVPILFRYEFGTGGRPAGSVQPFFNFGASPAFNVSCSIETSGPVTASDDCGDGAKSFDIGLVGGAGLAFHGVGRNLTIGVRYTHGLTDIADNLSSKNRVWAIVGTMDFPSRRRR